MPLVIACTGHALYLERHIPGARFFDPLTWHIEQFFHTGKPQYPVERTLLTSTVLDLGMHSLKNEGQRVSSDALAIKYAAPESSGFFQNAFAVQVTACLHQLHIYAVKLCLQRFKIRLVQHRFVGVNSVWRLFFQVTVFVFERGRHGLLQEHDLISREFFHKNQ